MNKLYGNCPLCGEELQAEWFVEKEVKFFQGHFYRTGRERDAIDYLYCPCCLHYFTVDDSFDSPWREER